MTDEDSSDLAAAGVDTEASPGPERSEGSEGPDEVSVETLIDDLDSVIEERDRLRDEIVAVTSERDTYLADSQRLVAEFSNFRRQTDKRSAELRAQAAGALVERLLPVLDACDGAIQHGAADVAPIRAAFFDVLDKEGLVLVDPLPGEGFDPNHHEAVGHVPAADGDDDGPVIDSVMRVGYVWNGRVLRAAMVTVRG